MLKHFRESIILTVLGFTFAWFWASNTASGSELKTMFVVFFLSILEVTLSFDNAVVNAVVLDKMTPKWQHRFLTWGILIAVFGVRFLLPVIIVSAFSGLTILNTIHMALKDVTQYTHYLELAHPSLVSFGGSFLLMVGLHYFVGQDNKYKWLASIEKILAKINKWASPLICLIIIGVVLFFVEPVSRLHIGLSGISGVIAYEVIHGIANLMEKSQGEKLVQGVKTGGVMMFIYLETIDASFSLDGVLGSFAISRDIVIIAIGLAIGAMFVRSLTLLLVEKKTLAQFVYLVSGAHFAIMALAVIMFISIFHEVNEIITGSLGLLFVGSSFVSSLIENKKHPENALQHLE